MMDSNAAKWQLTTASQASTHFKSRQEESPYKPWQNNHLQESPRRLAG
jgi:hypothetical protein